MLKLKKSLNVMQCTIILISKLQYQIELVLNYDLRTN